METGVELTFSFPNMYYSKQGPLHNGYITMTLNSLFSEHKSSYSFTLTIVSLLEEIPLPRSKRLSRAITETVSSWLA